MKKAMKVVGIIVLIIVGLFVILIVKNWIESQLPAISEKYYEDFVTSAELEKKYSQLGSYEVDYAEVASDNEAIQKVRFWYPKELENNAEKYPAILVVNGSNTPSRKIEAFFKRLASWGFIVIGNEDPQTGTGETASKTLEIALNLSDNVLAGRIDKENLGIVGYSQGGAGAIRAVTEFKNGGKYKTMFTGSAAYPLLAKNMGWEYDTSKVSIPYFMCAGTGNSDDRGIDNEEEFKGVSPLSELIVNYDNINGVTKVRGRIVDAEHEEMLAKSDGYMTAWMLYYLQDNQEAGGVFFGESPEIKTNSNWQDVDIGVCPKFCVNTAERCKIELK